MKIFGDWESSYETLLQYLDAVKASNPGTRTAHYYDHHSHGIVHFRRVLWAFGPSIAGFQYCRPLLSNNSTHLFGKYKDIRLIATGVDAKGGLFPLAFVAVEEETQAIWHWFISRIYNLLTSVRQDRRITFISNRHKGIPNALRDSWPSPYTYIKANFEKEFKDKLPSFTMASRLCIRSRIVQGQTSKTENCVKIHTIG